LAARVCFALITMLSLAHADPGVLRFATAAPEGSGWARELKAVTREMRTTSHGALNIKWYFGSIAGTEDEVENRIHRGQLDGIASGGMLCMRLAPTMRIARLPGLFENRDEVMSVLNRLHAEIDAEFLQHGFISLGWSGFGFDAIFSRKPVATMAELRAGKFWLWSLDPVWQEVAREMGIHFKASEPNEALAQFQSENLDGMIANPTVALVFQWSAQTRYFTPLHASFLPVCLILTKAAYEGLTVEQRDALRGASAKMLARVNDVSESTDKALLGGLFEKQGLHPVPVTAQFRHDFLEEAKRARRALGDKLVPQSLLQKVETQLAELRAAAHRR
jgi:TRAP-type C4-dicarboxylate transport system substrate-binding protein